MGDGADMAIDNAFDDCEEWDEYVMGNFSPDEAYDRGIIDELGNEYPGRVMTPCASRITTNPSGPGSCPKCGGETFKQSGKSGQFYGCKSYPKCNGSRNWGE